MKVFLSDLHLGDGKERDDFQYHKEFDELVRKLCDEFKNVEMILLGDIFDLIRTQKYCECEPGNTGERGQPLTQDRFCSRFIISSCGDMIECTFKRDTQGPCHSELRGPLYGPYHLTCCPRSIFKRGIQHSKGGQVM